MRTCTSSLGSGVWTGTAPTCEGKIDITANTIINLALIHIMHVYQ